MQAHAHTVVWCFATILRWPNISWKTPTCNVSVVGFQWKQWQTRELAMSFFTVISAVTRVWARWKRYTTVFLWSSYLGTRESPPLKVVGSSSNMEEMSFPSGTDTRVYMTLSGTFLKRALKTSCSESSWRERSKNSLIRSDLALKTTHRCSHAATEIIWCVCQECVCVCLCISTFLSSLDLFQMKCQSLNYISK